MCANAACGSVRQCANGLVAFAHLGAAVQSDKDCKNTFSVLTTLTGKYL